MILGKCFGEGSGPNAMGQEQGKDGPESQDMVLDEVPRRWRKASKPPPTPLRPPSYTGDHSPVTDDNHTHIDARNVSYRKPRQHGSQRSSGPHP